MSDYEELSARRTEQADAQLDRAYREESPHYRKYHVAVAQVHATLAAAYATLAIMDEAERNR